MRGQPKQLPMGTLSICAHLLNKDFQQINKDFLSKVWCLSGKCQPLVMLHLAIWAIFCLFYFVDQDVFSPQTKLQEDLSCPVIWTCSY